MGRPPNLNFFGGRPSVSLGLRPWGQEKLRSISRIPGGDRVAVKVAVVQVEKVNDQMGQGRSV